MGFFDFFRTAAPKKRTLSEISVDELNRERINCQQEMAKVERELEKLLKDESQLKNEYASAVSDSQRKSIARKIQDGRMRQRQVEGWISRVSQNQRIVQNFLMIKKNEEFYKRAGVLQILNTMDVVEIERFINESVVNGTLDNEKLVEILTTQENGLEQLFPVSTDSSLDDLMKELDRETAPIRDAQKGAEADKTLNKIQEDIQKKAEDGIRTLDQMLKER